MNAELYVELGSFLIVDNSFLMYVNKMELIYKQWRMKENECFKLIKFLLIDVVNIFSLNDVSRETDLELGG